MRGAAARQPDMHAVFGVINADVIGIADRGFAADTAIGTSMASAIVKIASVWRDRKAIPTTCPTRRSRRSILRHIAGRVE
jgi:hypothetical protein